MRGALLFIIFVLLHFIAAVESKICPKCEVPPFLKTDHPLNVTPSQPLDIKTCLYPYDIQLHPKLIGISEIATPVCLYIIPLRDDFLQFYFPSINDTYFERFWEENGDRCLKYFNNEVFGFYNLEKYDNLPTDIIYSCSRPFNDSVLGGDQRDDQLNTYLSKLVLQYIQEMEGKPLHRVMRCYDRDTDLSNSHWTLYTCMFAVMNRTFNIGPLSFNSFYVDHDSSNYSMMENTFLSTQGRQEGCAIADLDAERKNVEITRTKKSYNYLNDGECTGTLNLYGFDLLCCCYLNVHNCLYTAPPDAVTDHSDIRGIERYPLKDNQFLCIKGFLNSTSPELKFRGKREDILTNMSRQCYTMFTVTYEKDLVFNVSITFGSVDNEKSIKCEEGFSDDKGNSNQYLKSPWRFQTNYDIRKEPIEIVRCCKGNFCNHYGMFDYKNSYSWPKKFQFKMNQDWKMRCGYVPLDIFWNFFQKQYDTRECKRVISEAKTQELLPVIGGNDVTNLPLYIAKERDDANFTRILPSNFKPIFCFYAPAPKSSSLNRSGIPYIPRMVFGCSIKDTFTLPFYDTPDFNSQIILYQQNILRKLKKQYFPFPRCLTTNGASLELLSFLRVDKMEKLLWYPICFGMVYRDFHTTYYRSGACNSNETCCEPQYWSNGFFDVSTLDINSTTNIFEARTYTAFSQPIYRCTSLSCKSSQMESRCLYYAGVEYTPAEIVSWLQSDEFKINLDSVSPPVSVTVDALTGYDPATFKEKNRKRDVTAFDLSCVSSDQCFEEGSVFQKFDVFSAFPFCIWNLQRQYGSDLSREVLVADASNSPDRARFQMDCQFDFGNGGGVSMNATNSSSLQTGSSPLAENEKIVKPDL